MFPVVVKVLHYVEEEGTKRALQEYRTTSFASLLKKLVDDLKVKLSGMQEENDKLKRVSIRSSQLLEYEKLLEYDGFKSSFDGFKSSFFQVRVERSDLAIQDVRSSDTYIMLTLETRSWSISLLRGGVGMEYVFDLANPFPQLRDWLDLSLNYPVPSSLLILSRATLFSLHVDTVGVTSFSFEDTISERQRKLEKGEEEEEAKKKHLVKSNKDVALQEMINAIVSYAPQQLCKASQSVGLAAACSKLATTLLQQLAAGCFEGPVMLNTIHASKLRIEYVITTHKSSFICVVLILQEGEGTLQSVLSLQLQGH
ncbi:hypothetical protein Tco_1011436 [Tanacetum coccineum]